MLRTSRLGVENRHVGLRRAAYHRTSLLGIFLSHRSLTSGAYVSRVFGEDNLPLPGHQVGDQ